MTLKRRLGVLESQEATSQLAIGDKPFSRAELERMSLEELAALYSRLGRESRQAPPHDPSEVQQRVEAITDAELLSAYLSYGADL